MVRAVAITSGGPTQDFVVTTNGGLGGLTPKAAIVIVTRATTNLVRADGASISYGVVAENSPGVYGTFCIASSADDSVTTTNTAHRTSITDVVCLLGTGSLVDAQAQIVTFIADGVQLTWSNFPSTAVLVTVILFAGSDVSAAVGQFTQPVNINGSAVVNSLSFGPEVLMVLGSVIVVHENTDDAPDVPWANMMIGFAENITIPTPSQFRQCSRRWQSTDGNTTAVDNSYISKANATGSILGYVAHDGARAIEITAFDGVGFTATARLSGGATAYKYGYLALSFGGTTSHLVMTERLAFGVAPTSAAPITQAAVAIEANDTLIAPSFKPQFVLQLAAPGSTFNAILSSSALAGACGINCFTAFESFSNSISDDDAATGIYPPSGAGATESFTSNDLRTRHDSANGNFNVVLNGTFAADTGWTKGAGWTISGGAATTNGVAISTNLSQTVNPLAVGNIYQVAFTITRTAGSITAVCGATSGTPRSASGTFTENIVVTSTGEFKFTTNGFAGTVDNVTIIGPTLTPDMHIATLVSFDPTGWTKQYTLGPLSTAHFWPTLLIGETSGGGGPVAGDAALAGTVTVAPAGRVAYAASAAPASLFVVTSNARVALAGSVVLSSNVAVVAAGSVTLVVSSAATSLFTVAAVPLLIVGGQAALNHASTVAADATVQLTGALAVSGVFTVSAAGLMTRRGTATLTATASVAANAKLTFAGSSTVSGVFTVAAVGVVTRNATAALSSSFAVSAVPSLALPGEAALSGVFTLSGSPAGSVSGTAPLLGVWTITSNATLTHQAQSALAASFSVSAETVVTIVGESALTSSFAVSAAADLVVGGEAELLTTFTKVADGALAIAADAVMSSAFTLSTTGLLRLGGVSALATTFTLSADSTMTYSAASALVSSFSVTADGVVVFAATAALASTFTVGAESTGTHAGTAVVASEFTITPGAQAAYSAATALSFVFTVTASPSTVGDTPGTWNSYGTPRRYLQADNFGISFGLEVYMRALAGRVNARLYNVTNSAAVAGSELYVDALDTTAFVFKKTAALSLTDNRLYVSQFSRSAGGTGEMLYAAPVDVNV
jgi:hypothetical protein